MTQFAVATEKQAEHLRTVLSAGIAVKEEMDRPLLQNGLLEMTDNLQCVQVSAVGGLALELREALGPDRNLTVAGAKALVHGAPTRATKIRLMDDGLWKREYMLGRGHELAWLTEDGLNVREILMKNRVTF